MENNNVDVKVDSFLSDSPSMGSTQINDLGRAIGNINSIPTITHVSNINKDIRTNGIMFDSDDGLRKINSIESEAIQRFREYKSSNLFLDQMELFIKKLNFKVNEKTLKIAYLKINKYFYLGKMEKYLSNIKYPDDYDLVFDLLSDLFQKNIVVDKECATYVVSSFIKERFVLKQLIDENNKLSHELETFKTITECVNNELKQIKNVNSSLNKNVIPKLTTVDTYKESYFELQSKYQKLSERLAKVINENTELYNENWRLKNKKVA